MEEHHEEGQEVTDYAARCSALGCIFFTYHMIPYPPNPTENHCVCLVFQLWAGYGNMSILKKTHKEATTMTEKTTRQIENLKNQTIGVEIEMNNITREDAAKIAAEFFGDPTNYKDTAYRNGYMGRPGARVEIPEGRKHRGTRQPEVRDGHADPDLQRH